MWYDEFNGAAVDTGKWEFTIGGGGFGNNEQQYYTDSTDNAFIRDGSLVLKAIQGEYGGEDYTSAKLLFFLGNVTGAANAAHTLYFDDITLMPVADELVANGDFALSLDSWTTWTENGGSFAAPESDGYFTATMGTTLPNTWSSQLYQNVNITEPGTYRLSFSAKASMPRQICVAVEKDGMSPPLNHTFDISGEWAEYSVEFTVATPIDQAKLVFMPGCVGTTQNVPHTVSLDDISLCRIN